MVVVEIYRKDTVGDGEAGDQDVGGEESRHERIAPYKP
jgi:hypothetical protein